MGCDLRDMAGYEAASRGFERRGPIDLVIDLGPEPYPRRYCDPRPILKDGSRKAVRIKRDPSKARFGPGMPLPSIGRVNRPAEPMALLKRRRGA